MPGDSPSSPSSERPIQLVLADVDGTLVTNDKQLTPRTVEAVHALHDAGIAFAVTSGRPPRGMSMLVEPLALTTVISGFNGGLTVEPDMTVLDEKEIPADLVGPVLEQMESAGLDTWVYRGTEWYVRRVDAPHVDREAWTVEFAPTVVDSYDDLRERVVKLVGVSDDHDAVRTASEAARERFGHAVSAAASQPYYLDVTNPDANKAAVVAYLAERLSIPRPAIATLGDMPNDILMFAHSGISIAMGNADEQVKRCARFVTASNDEDGFAKAIERYVLGRR